MLIGNQFKPPSVNVSRIIGVQKFGRIADIDAGESGPVWSGDQAYAFPAAAEAMTVSSTSAQGAGGGTGVQDITIVYLDSSGVETLASLALDGQTGVALPSDVWRVYRAWCGAAGSGGVNAGDIWIGSGTVTAGVPANAYAHISAGRGQTHMAIYTIPHYAFDKDGDLCPIEFGRVLRWGGDCGSNRDGFASIELLARSAPGESWRSRDVKGIGNGGSEKGFAFGVDLAPGSDVMVNVISNGENNTSIEAGFDIALVVSP